MLGFGDPRAASASAAAQPIQVAADRVAALVAALPRLQGGRRPNACAAVVRRAISGPQFYLTASILALRGRQCAILLILVRRKQIVSLLKSSPHFIYG